MPRVCKFQNGIFTVRKGSVIALKTERDPVLVQVLRFEREFIITQEINNPVGELWNYTSDFTLDFFIQ